jgi:hypothetical protein
VGPTIKREQDIKGDGSTCETFCFDDVSFWASTDRRCNACHKFHSKSTRIGRETRRLLQGAHAICQGLLFPYSSTFAILPLVSCQLNIQLLAACMHATIAGLPTWSGSAFQAGCGVPMRLPIAKCFESLSEDRQVKFALSALEFYDLSARFRCPPLVLKGDALYFPCSQAMLCDDGSSHGNGLSPTSVDIKWV